MAMVDGGRFRNAQEAVARWASWVEESAEIDLDPMEWQFGLLECRDAVDYWLAASGDPSIVALADEVDAQFCDLTETSDVDRYGKAAGTGWWYRRVPRDPDARAYMTNYGRP